jgi:hypothetical protein
MEIPKADPALHQFEIQQVEDEEKPSRPFFNFVKYTSITLISTYAGKNIF